MAKLKTFFEWSGKIDKVQAAIPTNDGRSLLQLPASARFKNWLPTVVRMQRYNKAKTETEILTLIDDLMKCQTLVAVKKPLELCDQKPLSPGKGEVVVALKYASLNRRDYWITQGLYPGLEPPVVLGSDGAGVVQGLGEGVDSDWMGREVIMNPGIGWGSDPRCQAYDFQILGLPLNGTLASQVVVPVENLYSKPDTLSWQQSAAIPLAGVTAYRALITQAGLKKGERVLVSGIGGGVATFVLQFAVALGADVWVTSSSEQKIEKAIDLKAKSGFLYTDPQWTQKAKQDAEGFDVIVDSAGGKGYDNLVTLANPGGRIVNYGATTGPPEKLDLFKVFWKQLTIHGSTMGSPDDFKNMLELIANQNVKPLIDQVVPLESTNEALSAMANSPQFGKYVIDIENTNG